MHSSVLTKNALICYSEQNSEYCREKRLKKIYKIKTTSAAATAITVKTKQLQPQQQQQYQRRWRFQPWKLFPATTNSILSSSIVTVRRPAVEKTLPARSVSFLLSFLAVESGVAPPQQQQQKQQRLSRLNNDNDDGDSNGSSF